MISLRQMKSKGCSALRHETFLAVISFLFFSMPSGWCSAEERGRDVAATQLEIQLGHTLLVNSAVFSPDGRTVLTASWDATACLWETATGRELRRYQGHDSVVNSAVFSPDGRTVLTASKDKTARVWETVTGRELQRFNGHDKEVRSAVISPDGRTVLTAESWDAHMWETSTGRELRRFEGHSQEVTSAVFSPDSRTVLTASRSKIHLWDAATRRELRRFEGQGNGLTSAVFSPDGRAILTASVDKTVRLWETTGGREPRRFEGHSAEVTSAVFSPEGRKVLTASEDKTARLWETATGRELRRFQGHSDGVHSAVLAPDGLTVLTASEDKTARLWETSTGRELRRFEGHNGSVNSAVFSPDGRTVVTASVDDTARLWETATGRELRRFEGHAQTVKSAVFSPDGRTILTASWDKTARLWDTATGKELRRFRGHDRVVHSAVFSPNGRTVLTASVDHIARLWDTTTGRELRRFQGRGGDMVYSAAFSPDGRTVLTAGEDQVIRIWNAGTGEEIARLVSFTDATWAVVDREGRFDASNGGEISHLYWVVVLEEAHLESIDLAQLKDRYFKPGLLAKKLGLNSETLRDVAAFNAPKLHPELKLNKPTPNDPVLRVALANRGGGIGRVVVSVNGKEMTSDARPRGRDPNVNSLSLTLPLSAYSHWLRPGQKNRIEVRAYNAEDYLASRAAEVLYEPRGETPLPKVSLWAVIVGVSDYAGGEQIDLRYAAKDADDMAKAIELGARRLFGAANVQIKLMTTTQTSPVERPTKGNIKSAFEALAGVKPDDIIVAYFSGHGVAVNDVYHFPTEEASSTNLDDPEVREQRSVSSDELAQWLKRSPAQHQVLILDTCAAGTAINSLVESRNVPADQVRALERLKDRTRVHVLMGSAADRVSYEATRFEQGLMTHALLRGMKGEALREDSYVDVGKLFNYVADEVPRLAIDIGGIQRPYIVAPKASSIESFDIGKLTGEDRVAIALHSPRPLLLRPILLNETVAYDDLGLEPKLRMRLREASFAQVRGGKKPVAFVEADELPGAIRPSGLYIVSGNKVRAKIILRRNAQTRELQVDGMLTDLDAFTEQMMEAIVHMSGDWN